jgi:hypothetical protein
MKRQYPKRNNVIGNLLLLVCCSSFLLIPALINGYPIVNSDTGTYLFSGFLCETPADRPITYGLLIRALSGNGATLWTVVIVQACVVAALITMIIRHYFVGRQYYIISLLMVLLLATTTSLSWIVCELIADVYTTIGFLATICLFICKTNKIQKILLYALLFVTICTHMSHAAIFIVLIIALFIFRKQLFRQENIKEAIQKVSIIAGICILSLVALSPTAAKSKHDFLMASFLQKGILKKYLDDKCPTIPYKICKYRNTMEDDPNWFLWSSESPFQKEGCWDGTRKEYTAINNDILMHMPYNTLFIEQSIPYTLQQLVSFKIGDGNTVFDCNSNIAFAIGRYVSNSEYEQFLASMQNTQSYITGKLNLFNTIIMGIVIISIMGIMLLFILSNCTPTYSMKQLLLICFTGIIVNCWDCATFAQVNGRYGCRVMWLLPFCFIVMLLSKKKINSEHCHH